MAETGFVADAIDGIPHPGECHTLMGHSGEVEKFLANYQSGKLHHAHMITGPRGVGKASFAMRLASHLFHYPDFSHSPGSLQNYDVKDPVEAKIASRSHPNLLHMTRPWDDKNKKFKTQLTVDEIGRTRQFFGTSRSADGWRIAIVDSVDDMNNNASNALLKILEEPPDQTVFFVLSHSPAKVLPTIRSRCQHIALKPLGPSHIKDILKSFGLLEGVSEKDVDLLSRLSNGSARNAILLVREAGLDLYHEFSKLVSAKESDWTGVQTLADKICGRGKEDRYHLVMGFAKVFLENQATGKGDDHWNSISRLARWAEVWEKTNNAIRTAEAYNLDQKQVIINLFQNIGEMRTNSLY